MKSLRKSSVANNITTITSTLASSSSSTCLIAKTQATSKETLVGMRMIFYDGDAIAMQIFGAFTLRNVLFGNSAMQVGPNEVQYMPCTCKTLPCTC